MRELSRQTREAAANGSPHRERERAAALPLAGAPTGRLVGGGTPSPADILALQRTVGNRAVRRLLSPGQVFDAASAGPARALPFRADMERSFGRDLGGARVVTARPELRAMGAEAATRGDTLVFAKESPSRVEVAHELTHFVQNHPGASSPRPGPVQAMSTVSGPEDEAEREASAVALRAAAGQRVEVHAPPAAAIHRMLVGWELETTVPIYDNGERDDHVDGYAEQKSDYAHENVDDRLRAMLGDGFELHVDSSSLAKRSALTLINPSATMHIVEVVAKPVASRAALLDNMEAVREFLSWFENARELTGESHSIGWPTPTSDYDFTEPEPPQQDEADDVAPRTTTHARADLEGRFNADWQGTVGGKLYEAYTQLTFQGPPSRLQTIADLDVESRIVKTQVQGQKKPVLSREPVNLASRDTMSRALGIGVDGPLTTRAIDVAVKIFKDALGFLGKPHTGTVKNSVDYLIRSDLGNLFADIEPEERLGLMRYIEGAILGLQLKALDMPPELQKKLIDPKTGSILLSAHTFKLVKNPPEQEKGELEHLDPALRAIVERDAVEHQGTFYLPWKSFLTWFAGEVAATLQPVQREAPARKQVTGPLHGSNNLGLLPEPDDDDAPKARVVFESRKTLVANVDRHVLPRDVVEELDKVGFPQD